jgi:hypothetical protein
MEKQMPQGRNSEKKIILALAIVLSIIQGLIITNSDLTPNGYNED